MTFVPHPHQILSSNFKHYLINSYPERRSMLESLGVDFLIEIDFNRDFSTKRPEDFLEQFVFASDKIKEIHLGHDFAFGMNKQGSFDLVKEMGQARNIVVVVEEEYKDKDLQISSSRVRELIREGKMIEAAKFLGRPFYLSGPVIKGEGRGKKIGFPTANLQLDTDIIVPMRGVYITRTTIKGMTYNSLTNIGKNPTFNDQDVIHVETFILDFDQDIYGESLSISFLEKIRDEKKFESVNGLIEQLNHDVEKAKKYFC